MNNKNFDYTPLADNKNDRVFKVDVLKDKDVPDDAVYVKLGDMNSHIMRYVVMWGDEVNDSPSLGLRSVSDLVKPH